MSNNCDLVVIGAGPAGLMAGIEAAGRGLRTTIVERNDRIGYPLNCAEGVTIPSLEGIVDVRPTWIRAQINRGLLVSPSGYTFELDHPNAGYILNRPAMEQDLADDFVSAGGNLMTGHRVIGIDYSGDRFRSVTVVDSVGRSHRLAARVFIAADGVEGTIARLAGIDNLLDIHSTESLLQYRLSGVSVDSDLMEIHVGTEVAPRSYLWIFPAGGDRANVGLGVSCAAEQQPKTLLDGFVARRFSGARIVSTSCGTVPRYQGRDKLAEKNLLVVGDAARLLDSATGAGIANAMLSGRLAGKAAALWCAGHEAPWKELHGVYPREFLEAKHEQLNHYRLIKAFLDRLSDSDLDEIVRAFNGLLGGKTIDSINPAAILLDIVRKGPRLLKVARHFF